MKKLAILTSVLALAACGGGSGSNGGISNGLTPAQRAAVESNKNVTGMLTYLSTDAHGNTVQSRSSVVSYTAGSYDLEDVRFVAIDEDFEDVENDEGGSFETNADNKIIGFNVGLKELGEEYPNYNSQDPEFGRVDDTNKFRGLINTSEGWVNGELEYNSLGLLAGLRYSDFGNIAVKNLATDKYAQRMAFIGGYDDAKRVDPTNVTGNNTFTGYASGSVVSVLHGDDDDLTHCLNLDTSKNSSDERKMATLTVNNGESTLTAKFDNWYDVEYVKSGNDKQITFSNYTDAATLTDVNDVEVDADEFRMLSDNGAQSFTLTGIEYEIYDEGNPTGEYADNLNSEVRYFGDHGSASEAVGLVQIRDKGTNLADYDNINDYDAHPEIRMNLSFGGKK